jgi:predicted DNA-binding transcriptional regulator AlpA
MPADRDRHFLITWAQLKPQIPYVRQHVLRLEDKDEFPQRVQVGPGRVCWWQDEIDEWLASRARGAPPQRAQLGPKAPPSPAPDDTEALSLLRQLAAKHGLDLVPQKSERRKGGSSP